jgi:hypothetical protein
MGHRKRGIDGRTYTPGRTGIKLHIGADRRAILNAIPPAIRRETNYVEFDGTQIPCRMKTEIGAYQGIKGIYHAKTYTKAFAGPAGYQRAVFRRKHAPYGEAL